MVARHCQGEAQRKRHARHPGGLWRLHDYKLWLFGLRDRLPTVDVPLTADVAEVAVDLQAALDLAYDRGAYGRRLEYSQPLELELDPADREWAYALLRRAKISRAGNAEVGDKPLAGPDV